MMKQADYTVVSNDLIADSTYRITLEGDTSAFSRGGQFADVAVEGKFLRRPLAVTQWDDYRFSMIYKVVGEGTTMMSRLTSGDTLNILTGLGNGFDASCCSRAALVVCGGIGASPVFSLVRELLDKGCAVTVVMGFNKSSEIILEKELRDMGAAVYVATMDGSSGFNGLVTELIAEICPEYDYFYTCGPKVMMKAVCEALDGPGELSMEERMGCGVGICYGCTCHTTKGAKRICKDGPVFKKEDIVW